MPKHRPPHRPPHDSQGFTLIEILVVTAIIAILLGLAVVKLDFSDASRLNSTADDLVMRLEAARDEAVIRGQSLAFSSDGQGYQFWLSDSSRNEWVAPPANDPITSKQFSGGIVLNEMRINGLRRPMGERLVFSLSGLTEPFILGLSKGSAHAEISSDALGRMEIRHAQ